MFCGGGRAADVRDTIGDVTVVPLAVATPIVVIPENGVAGAERVGDVAFVRPMSPSPVLSS